MNYRKLGSSGLLVSELSLGSWITFGAQIENDTSKQLLHYAYDSGVNFFDNAETYAKGRSEEVMGHILADSGWTRDTYIISSKAYFGAVDNPRPNQTGLSRKHLVEACHAALRRLRLDYLDLYYCHRPDASVPMFEIVRTMNDLVAQGKVLYWGTSEWPADLIIAAHECAERHHLIPPVMEQPQYSLVVRDRVEREYAPLYSRYGMGTTTWSPLAAGLLSGKYTDGIPADSRLAQTTWLRALMEGQSANGIPGTALKAFAPIARVAAAAGLPPARFAIAWCLRNPKVSTVILGASRVEQLTENLLAAGDVAKLTPDVLAAVDQATAGLHA
ncbi:aldo/keto reductase [bacterium]|nr:aldo/keto reductase [bacterium]